MATPYVTEQWSTNTLGVSGGVIRGRRVFDVTGVNNKTQALQAVADYDPLTAYSQPHPLSSLCYVDGRDCDTPGLNVHRVTISYSSTAAGRHPNPESPLLEPIEFDYDPCSQTEPVDVDMFGNHIANRVGDGFDSAASSEFTNAFMVAERNEPYYNAQMAMAYMNAIASSDVSFGVHGVWKRKRGQACVRMIKPVTKITPASTFTRVRYVVEFRDGEKLDSDGYWDGFKTRLLNQGRNAYYDSTHKGPIAQNIKGDWQEVSSSVRLDKDGKPIGAGYKVLSGTGAVDAIASPVALPSGVIVETTDSATFMKYFPRRYRLLDLSALGLITA